MPTVPDIHRRGTRAAQATLSPPLTVGTLYFVTDESVTERWNGTAWESYSGPDAGSAPGVAHAPTHQSGGSDALAVTALAGFPGGTTNFLRADATFAAPPAGGGAPSAHAASHQNGGADEISVAGLSGLLGDSQVPLAHSVSHETGGSDAITALAASVITTGTIASARLPARSGAVGIVIDGGGTVLTTGVKGFVEVPFACTITAATLLSTDASVTSGSIVIDVWKDTYAAYPPVVGDSITASAKPTLSSATKSRDTTLTGWTTAIAAGDVLGFSVTSVSLLTRVTLTLTVQVT